MPGRSQISIPPFKFLRGELAIAKKFGQYKQIKSGNCSVVTQSFHSLIYTVILHYPLIVTYTFHSPNMKDKYWNHLKLCHFPGWPAGQGKHFQRVLAAIYWSHSSERALHPWNFSVFTSEKKKVYSRQWEMQLNRKSRDNVASGTGRSPRHSL